jgi:hypothetical protein
MKTSFIAQKSVPLPGDTFPQPCGMLSPGKGLEHFYIQTLSLSPGRYAEGGKQVFPEKGRLCDAGISCRPLRGAAGLFPVVPSRVHIIKIKYLTHVT